MFEKTFIIGIVVVTLLIVGGGILLSSKSSNTPNTASSFTTGGKAIVDNNFTDWGKIVMGGGNKEEMFVVRNEGDTPLKLRNARTSCHCTVTTIFIDGNSSDKFGMNGSGTWVGEIPPNSKADITVIFDPAFHGPKGVGPIERYVQIQTSDPNMKTIDFTVKGVVEK
jgi:hypothetical protein